MNPHTSFFLNKSMSSEEGGHKMTFKLQIYQFLLKQYTEDTATSFKPMKPSCFLIKLYAKILNQLSSHSIS